MRKIIYLIILLFLVSCNNSKDKDKENKAIGDFPNLLDDEALAKLERVAIDSNSIKAYSELQGRRYRTRYEYQIHLNTAIHMANRNGYRGACFDIFDILSTRNDKKSLASLDEKTRCLALYYLLKGYEDGDFRAQSDVKKYFQTDSIPNANYYLIKMASIP